MLYRLKRISAPQGYFSCHFFVWYIATIAIVPYNAYRALFFIALSAVLIMMYVSFPSLRPKKIKYRFQRRKGVLKKMPSTSYEIAVSSMFLATIFGSLTAVLVTHINYFSLETVLVSLLLFSFFVLIFMKYYTLSFGSRTDDDKGVFSGASKIGSLLIMTVTFGVSTKLIMDVMDIPDAQAVSKKTTIAFQLISIVYLIPLLIPVFQLLFLFVEEKMVEIRKKEEGAKARFFLVEYDYIFIVIPLIAIIILCYSGAVINKRDFINSIINRAIEMDTSISFNCNGYKMLGTKEDARYLLVSENNYRAFVRDSDSYRTYRLTCTNSYPYYQLRYIPGNKQEIRLQMAEDTLIEDMNKVLKR